MARIHTLFVALFIQTIASQRIQLQQIQQPTCQSQIIADPSIFQLPAPGTQSNVMSDYSIDLCKNLATAVQNMVLNKLAQSAYKKPIFNQIAGPLLNDIALRTQNQCPVCGTLSAVQNVVSSPCSQVQSIVNQVPSYQSLVSPLQNQIQTLVNPVGNQVQAISFGNLNQAQSCPCNNLNAQTLRLPNNIQSLNVQNQNQVATNAAQQKYNEAIAILESLKNGNSCGCGQRNGFSLF